MPAKKKAAAKKTAAKASRSNASAKSAKKSSDTPRASENGKGSSPKNGKARSSSTASASSSRRAPRKPGPVTFSLDDVREVLKERERDAKKAAEKAAAEAEATPAAKKEAANKQVEIDESAIKASKHGAASLADILGFGSVSSPSPSVPRNERTVPKKWTKYHRMLIELRDHVRQGLSLHSSDTLKRSQKEDAGDISTSADAGTDNFDRDFALSMLSSEQEALKEIEAAIERIYNGTYATCEVTGEKIAPERLEAVPFTRFSLQGQLEYERTARKRVQRTGAFLAEGSAENVSFGDDDNDG